MKVNDFCDSMKVELTAWKAKLYDALRKLDKVGTEGKGKIRANFEDMDMILTQMEDRINELENQCPPDWSPIRQEIDEGHVDLRSKYEQTLDEIGRAAPVSMP